MLETADERGGHDRVVGHRFEIRQWLAVDAGRDGRREVLGRMLAARRGHRVEMLKHVQQCGQLVLVGGAALVFAVVAAEQILGQREHAAEVGLRQSKQREIAFGRLRHHRVNIDLGQLVDANLQRVHGFWPEPVRGRPGVAGRRGG